MVAAPSGDVVRVASVVPVSLSGEIFLPGIDISLALIQVAGSGWLLRH